MTVLTPAMGQLLSADASVTIPSLKSAFFVGDVLAKRDVIRLQQLAPNCQVINMMGSTETQRSVSYFTIPPSSTNLVNQKEIIPAGKGMKDVQLLVLNKLMQPCGISEVGELFMRSHHMALGYLGLPEETAAKFLPNWFIPEATRKPTDRLYKTGDVGRFSPSGAVECMGRLDDQIKIRGFRVELREIDTFLIQHLQCARLLRCFGAIFLKNINLLPILFHRQEWPTLWMSCARTCARSCPCMLFPVSSSLWRVFP